MYILIGIHKGDTRPCTVRSASTKEGLICPVLVDNYDDYSFLGVIHLPEGGKATNVEKVIYHPPRPQGKLEFTKEYTV